MVRASAASKAPGRRHPPERSSSAVRTRRRPGPRGDGFYAGYFRDLDGNKLNALFMG
jgi:hypothetical protein